MMNRHAFLPAAIAASAIAIVGSLWFLPARMADAQANTARPTVIGVVNLGNVLQGLDEKPAREAELSSELLAREAALRAKQEQLKAVQDELDMLPEAQRTEKAEELLRMEYTLRFETELFQAIAVQRENELLTNFFNGIRAASARYADRQGIDIVITDDSRRDVPAQLQPQQLSGFIGSQRLLYSSSEVDITDEVIIFMNNEYKKTP